ncbi:ATP-dependent helicase [Microbacterium sp. LjRoot45]|uniref:UvrD-helicase domain-containing protein n=1 Tax=Microbacterium sp. LjRoot45 TaxID=3342329 RepID=UPI003ECEC5F1
MTITPTEAQKRIRDATAPDLLVIAPAGCGKTEALALRIEGLLRRGDVAEPKKVLVTTFSNRARDNIRERLQAYLPAAVLRDRVSVANFHGVAARLIRAHGNVIGIADDIEFPENDWVGQRCRELNFDFNTSAEVQRTLRIAKQDPRTDAQVVEYLEAPGREAPLRIEQERLAAGRLTYDDLPRLAELILANEQVAALYNAHFGAVVVDEFQDLTPQQLRIVNSIGRGRTTFAGDLAQGIYGFAGASPDEVSQAVRDECSEVVEFSESHRSSPAVLAMVNSLSGLTGGTSLTSATPASWPGGGMKSWVQHDTATGEAEWAAKLAIALIEHAPNHRVGIVARTGPRRRFVDAALSSATVEVYRWDDAVVDTDTANLLKSLLRQLNVVEMLSAADPLTYLRDAANYSSATESKDVLREALDWCHDLLVSGETAAAVRSRIRVGTGTTLITEPGIHLLTGHTGKGQQFDWVIVVGAEDGTIPDFRAKTTETIAEEARVLSVMLSRARHGVVLSYALSVPDKNGSPWSKRPTRFLTEIGTANPMDDAEMRNWLNTSDWEALSGR